MSFKTFSIVLLLAMCLVITACNRNKKDTSEQNEDQTTTSITTEATTVTTTEEVTTTEAEATPDETEEESEDGEMDISLMDRALLRSVKIDFPDTIIAEITRVSKFAFFPDDIPEEETDTIRFYQKDLSSWEETVSEDETSISIYNHDEKTSYRYTVGETTGFKTLMDEEAHEQVELTENYKGKTLLDYLEGEFELDQDVELKASREKILGRKAIKVTVTTPEEPDASLTFWFDDEYFYPLKFEWLLGEDQYIIHEVTEIDFNKRVDDDIFTPPSDINFP